jgi:hypothetical protein
MEVIVGNAKRNLFLVEARAFHYAESIQNNFRKFIAESKKDQVVQVEDSDERGDVPGWVLVVLMTTGLVTAIWTIAAPRLSAILKNSLDAMNGIR